MHITPYFSAITGSDTLQYADLYEIVINMLFPRLGK